MKPKCWPWAHVTSLAERGGVCYSLTHRRGEARHRGFNCSLFSGPICRHSLEATYFNILRLRPDWPQRCSMTPRASTPHTGNSEGPRYGWGGGLETSKNDYNKNTVCLCSHKERKRREEVGDQGSRVSVKVQREVWESTNKLRLQTYASWNYCNAMAVVLACLKEAACVSIVCLLNYK